MRRRQCIPQVYVKYTFARKTALIEHEGCNGWAIYESQYIDSDNAKNMHVVEGKITYHDGKEWWVRLVCG